MLFVFSRNITVRIMSTYYYIKDYIAEAIEYRSKEDPIYTIT